MFIYIWLLIIGWVVVPLFLFLLNDKRFNDQFLIDGAEMLNIHINFAMEPPNIAKWGAILLGLIVLPIYYIYFWIIVNSYRKSLNRRKRRTDRLEAAKQHNAHIMYNQPFYVSPNYGNEPFNYNAPYPTSLYHENEAPNSQEISTIAQSFPPQTIYDAQEMSNIQE